MASQTCARRSSILIAGNVANVVLELLFVYGFDWGIAGSAWGTAIAQLGMGAAFVVVVLRRLEPGEARVRLELARRVLSLGKWIFIRTTALMLSFVLAGAVATRFGDASIAAHQVAFQLWVFLALVLDSVAIAGQIIVGRELGAGRREEAYGASERMIWLSVALGGVFAALMLVLAGVLPRAFTGDASVLDETALLWPIFALMQPLNGAVFALDGILIGASDGPFLAMSMVAAFVACAAVLLAALEGDWGIRGVWAALVVLIVVRLTPDDDALPPRPLARHRVGVDERERKRPPSGIFARPRSHSRISVLRKTSVEAVGNAREDHARLEEQQPLDVERALVVEERGQPAEDELGHDHDGDRVGVGGELAQVARGADRRGRGRAPPRSRAGSACSLPAQSLPSRSASSASKAKKTACVSASPSVAGVVDGAHRRRVGPETRIAADRALAAARASAPTRARARP